VGLAPTGKRRLVTAHTQTGHSFRRPVAGIRAVTFRRNPSGSLRDYAPTSPAKTSRDLFCAFQPKRVIVLSLALRFAVPLMIAFG